MSLSMALCVATMDPRIQAAMNGDEPHLPQPFVSVLDTAYVASGADLRIQTNTQELNFGVISSYQRLYEKCREDEYTVLAYFHDDVEVHEEGWDERVLREFEDPSTGVVGFGGGLSHGTEDLYKRPYALNQLARGSYLSNTIDAEAHGHRYRGACTVAVLDGFALIVRRELLDRGGGWPAVAGGFHCYDYAICALAHRLGYRVRLVGVGCHHLGGRTSTTPAYQAWSREQGMSDAERHEESHRWFYEEFRDVMPWREKWPDLTK